MFLLLAKAVAIWLVILVTAILNAAIREKILAPLIGPRAALPVSGLLLSAFIVAVAYLFIPFFGARQEQAYMVVGSLWFGLTLCFEFAWGYFVAGKPFGQIAQVFNIRKGDLFALFATLIAPWLAAKLRGLV